MKRGGGAHGEQRDDWMNGIQERLLHIPMSDFFLLPPARLFVFDQNSITLNVQRWGGDIDDAVQSSRWRATKETTRNFVRYSLLFHRAWSTIKCITCRLVFANVVRKWSQRNREVCLRVETCDFSLFDLYFSGWFWKCWYCRLYNNKDDWNPQGQHTINFVDFLLFLSIRWDC